MSTSPQSGNTGSPVSESVVAGQKRGASMAGVQGGNFRAVKRRASKACQCCRARKVRCNVVEHGAPCTNCRLDEVECIITESKRRKKMYGSKIEAKPTTSFDGMPTPPSSTTSSSVRRDIALFPYGPVSSVSPSVLSLGNDSGSEQEGGSHVPHLIYQAQTMQNHNYTDIDAIYQPQASLFNMPLMHNQPSNASTTLPKFIKPYPSRRPIEDLEFLHKKGALSIPSDPLRTELVKAHFEFVHPYMPLLDKKAFLKAISDPEGLHGTVGLLLFQAVMFAGSAFVDLDVLKKAGFVSRRAARRFFFTKSRLLYDLDMEPDRMTLVQSLLLMTYWYETPDDQKDTWHWMGVAISLSHTIGLHRNPEDSRMEIGRKRLWKRVWWSCVMRDRLVALGMRRPTRIKEEDCEVPMLTIDDFDLDGNELDGTVLEPLYTATERLEYFENQRKLAIMCIEKAHLCMIINDVLHAQYKVLNTNQGSLAADGSTRTTMMLLPKPSGTSETELERCDNALQTWYNNLSTEAQWTPLKDDEDLSTINDGLTLHRNLLHMCYCTTMSALHRPRVLPSMATSRPTQGEVREKSNSKVRECATQTTRLAEELLELDLVRYLPTTGVTVMLPAIIIHLLDIKSSNPSAREASLEGFGMCMLVMQSLRQIYASADYACKFLEFAIKKADISLQENKDIRERILKRTKAKRQRRRSSTVLAAAPRPPLEKIPETPSHHYGFSTANSRVVLTPPPEVLPHNGEPQTNSSGPSPADLFFGNDNEFSIMADSLSLESFLSNDAISIPNNYENPQTTLSNHFSSAPYLSIPHAPSAGAAASASTDSDPYDSLMILGKDLDPFLGHWDKPTESPSTDLSVNFLTYSNSNASPKSQHFRQSWSAGSNSESVHGQQVSSSNPTSSSTTSSSATVHRGSISTISDRGEIVGVQYANEGQNWMDQQAAQTRMLLDEVTEVAALGNAVKEIAQIQASQQQQQQQQQHNISLQQSDQQKNYEMTMEDLVFIGKEDEIITGQVGEDARMSASPAMSPTTPVLNLSGFDGGRAPVATMSSPPMAPVAPVAPA